MKCGDCARFMIDDDKEFGTCKVNHADGTVSTIHTHKDAEGCEVPKAKPSSEIPMTLETLTQQVMRDAGNILKEREQASDATLPDSGTRREFGTGAVRDCGEGKGRCDLLPLDAMADVTGDAVLTFINIFVRKGCAFNLHYAIQEFCQKYKSSNGTSNYFDWMLDYSKHMETGCQKYGDRNWEMGIPLHCYIDSGVRHYLKFMAGWTDEPHDRAFLWNMFGCAWTLKHKPEMNDLPFRESK